MSATEERVRELISQQAADWFVANRAVLSEQERLAFIDWLRASPFVAVLTPVPTCAKHNFFVYLHAANPAILKKLSDSSRQLT